MRKFQVALSLLGAGLLAGCNLLTAAPTVSIADPGTVTGTTLTVTINADGASGIQAVGASLNGVSLGEDRTAPYSFTTTVSRVNNGVNTISGYATNNAGGFAYAQPVKFTVNIAPSVSLGALASATGIALTATVPDTKGISKVEFYNGATLLATDTTAPYTHSASLAQVAATFPSYSAKAYDDTGNITTSSERIEDVWENASGTRNNSSASAVVLDAMPVKTQAGATLTASLDSTAFGASDVDVDYYAVNLSFAQFLKVRTFRATGVDTVVRIFDSSGNQLAFNDDGNSFGSDTTTDSAVNWRAVNNGTYYIAVSSYTNGQAPAAQGAGKQYRVNVQVGD